MINSSIILNLNPGKIKSLVSKLIFQFDICKSRIILFSSSSNEFQKFITSLRGAIVRRGGWQSTKASWIPVEAEEFVPLSGDDGSENLFNSFQR